MILAELTSILSRYVNRAVVDRTGLDGGFDWILEWTADGQVAADLDHVSIWTALQEQLGLSLESTRGPVDVLVIDGVEQTAPIRVSLSQVQAKAGHYS